MIDLQVRLQQLREKARALNVAPPQTPQALAAASRRPWLRAARWSVVPVMAPADAVRPSGSKILRSTTRGQGWPSRLSIKLPSTSKAQFE